MAADLNRVTLTGRLTRDPELRQTGGGTPVASLRLAYTTRRKDAGGEWSDRSNYIDVTVWGRQAETIERFCSKGSALAIDGRLEWREYETRDGEKRQTTELVLENFRFMGGDGEAGGGQRAASSPRSDIPTTDPGPGTYGGSSGHPSAEPVGAGGGGGFASPPPTDDDIPF